MDKDKFFLVALVVVFFVGVVLAAVVVPYVDINANCRIIGAVHGAILNCR